MNLPGRIVVLGGYGTFGFRISRALAVSGCAEIIVAGRNLERARRTAAALRAESPGARVRAATLDIGHAQFTRQLGAIAPIVVVHTAGPFQGQGFAVAEACLACRSHYIDLADGRDFVVDFSTLDRAARRRDVLLVTGASTLPGVSSAVVESLRQNLGAVHSIATSIVPAAQTRRGVATLAGVLSYCGKSVATLEGNGWRMRRGWEDAKIVDYGIFERTVAACDVPDLALFPEHYVGVHTVTFHAGTEQPWQMHALKLMATLARHGVVRDWSRHAGWLARLDAWTARFGTDIGAMQVRVDGESPHGMMLTRIWNLIARRNDGPQIPCTPAIVLAKGLIRGEVLHRGAKPCLGLVSLAELYAELKGFAIEWATNERANP